MPNKLDLVGVGTPSIDIIHTKKGSLQRFGGGGAITAIVALSKWGLKTGIIGRVGKDKNGRLLLEDFKANNVDTSCLQADKYPTCIWHIKVAKGEREILYPEFYKPLKKLLPADINYLKTAKSVFIRFNNPLFKRVTLMSKKYRKNLFVTFHLFETSQETENISAILDKCRPEIIFMNKEEAEKAWKLFDKVIETSLVVVTRGKKGCSVYKKGNNKYYKTIKVKRVDTTGAGDAFAAGFIYGYLNNWSIDKTAQFANIVGAVSTMDFGARTKIPALEEAFELMKLAKH